MDGLGHVIGIDLGTTNSVVAVCEAGELRVIPNAEGQTKTPSVVALNEDGQVIVGEIARRQATTQPQRTISSAKRLMGRLLNEIIEQEEEYPFELGEDSVGRVVVRVNGQELLPEQISAEILLKLKTAAEDYLGEPVTRAVITVPAYFDDLQRQATIEAAKLAGLEVLRLLNEPTAAAMAYGLGRDGQDIVAVYDFGGGTFDFSVLEIDNKTFEVLVSTGDSRLGGDDIDQVLVDWLAAEFLAKFNVELRDDMMALRRLKDAAEQAKCELSAAIETRISLPFIAYKDSQPLHFEIGLSRELLEEVAEPLVQRTLGCCQRALRDAKLRKEQLTRVILVGGSTRMPLVQDLVEDFFGIAPFKGLNPDEIVATGAAAQGAVMNGELEEVILLDVTPHCLGIEIKGGRKSTIVEKNSTIPLKVFKTFTTTEPDQSFVNVHVLQGDGERIADCRSVGKFTLSGITPCAAGVPRIKVQFFINADGIVDISAKDLQSGSEKSLLINHAYLSASERQQRPAGNQRRRKRRRSVAPNLAEGVRTVRASAGVLASVAGPRDLNLASSNIQNAESIMADTQGQFAVLNNEADSKAALPVSSREIQTIRAAGPVSAAPKAPNAPPIHAVSRPGITPLQDTWERRASAGTVNNLTAAPFATEKPETAETVMRTGFGGNGSAIGNTIGEKEKKFATPPQMPENLPPEMAILFEKLQQNCCDPATRQVCIEQRENMLRYCASESANAALQLILARFFVLIQQPEEAREVLVRVVRQEPALAPQCIELYSELCHEFPNYHLARRERGLLAATLGDWALAMSDLEFTLNRDDRDSSVAGHLCDLYQRVLNEGDNATVQFKLVKLHLRNRELDAAIGHLQQLVARAEYRDRANKVLGLCFWQKGMRYLAWQKFRGLPLDEEMKDILYRLASDMESNDELLHAKYALERIYEVDIQFRDVAERSKKLAYRLELQKDDRYGAGAPMPQTPFQDSVEFGKRFEVLGEINRGSMGIVYKTRDLVLDEIVAIKVLNDYMCSDPQAIERFKQEARSARKLTHQNVVRIHDMFDLGGKKFISMEYIEGENLKTLLARNATFTEDRIQSMLVQICEGLAYAHRLHVVHRDIKPANIMLTDRGVVKITDFGIAKIIDHPGTKSQTMVMGTPLYMAPEQIEGGRIDHRCDIYALGIMLYEMVTGNPPFCDGNIEYHHVHSPAPEIRIGISERLKQIIIKCIEKKPDHRFQSVEEILSLIV